MCCVCVHVVQLPSIALHNSNVLQSVLTSWKRELVMLFLTAADHTEQRGKLEKHIGYAIFSNGPRALNQSTPFACTHSVGLLWSCVAELPAQCCDQFGRISHQRTSHHTKLLHFRFFVPSKIDLITESASIAPSRKWKKCLKSERDRKKLIISCCLMLSSNSFQWFILMTKGHCSIIANSRQTTSTAEAQCRKCHVR